jgi:hypothetical protein
LERRSGNQERTENSESYFSHRNHIGAGISRGNKLSAIGMAREPIEWLINELPARTTDGLRAKALVALFHVQPLCVGDREYHFGDDAAFQQLFSAVCEFVGFAEMVATTGYRLRAPLELDEDDVLRDRVRDLKQRMPIAPEA